jgi:hypothetical protein
MDAANAVADPTRTSLRSIMTRLLKARTIVSLLGRFGHVIRNVWSWQILLKNSPVEAQGVR